MSEPVKLPTVPQLVRFRRRMEKAIDAIEGASYDLLCARRVFDGEKVPVRFPFAMADAYVEHADNILAAARALLASAATDISEQLEMAKGLKPLPPEPDYALLRAQHKEEDRG